MSFKRAGDDHCALRLQKKQRVTDLLAEDIPTDEAGQTRNGRFVCFVCPYNPVLDTMAMLVLHRQGKKHLANMAVKVEREHDLNELLQKREQEKYLREDTSSFSTRSFSQDVHTVSKNTNLAGPLLERTRQLTEAVKKQTKPRDYNKVESKVPENRKGPSEDSQRRNKPFFQSRVEIHLTRKFDKDCHKDKLLSMPRQEKSVDFLNAAQSLDSSCVKKSCYNFEDTNAAKKTNIEKKNRFCVDNGKVAKRKELSHEQQRYLELKRSGWILDCAGKWVKDANAEFDSDEDEP